MVSGGQGADGRRRRAQRRQLGLPRREDLQGTWAMGREAHLAGARAKERAERAKLYGLEAAASIRDRSLTLFNRSRSAAGHGGTFGRAPLLAGTRQFGRTEVHTSGTQPLWSTGSPLPREKKNTVR